MQKNTNNGQAISKAEKSHIFISFLLIIYVIIKDM